MQLKSGASIKAALSMATCALLNTPVVAAYSFDFGSGNTELKASNTLYAEDKRVIVDESIVSLKQEIDDAEFLKATVIVDVMSGASPNGLPRINKPAEANTVTSPSGGNISLRSDRDQTFHFRDTRGALALEWQKPLNRLLSTTTGLSFSTEYDYYSAGISSNWSRDTEDRLTTVNTGFAGNYDIINPVGGVPQGLTSTEQDKINTYKKKSEFDFLLGVTQVLTRQTLLQANYVANFKSGYLTDPYKLVIFLDNDDLAPVNNDPYFYEKRPDSRLSHIVFLNLIQNIKENVLKLSYRYFDDDWGIKSHTAEARFSINYKEKSSVQFKYRYYVQNNAYFYHYHLVDGEFAGIDSRDVVDHPGSLKYVSADYRLGNLQSHTLGMKISRSFPEKNARLDLRLDRIISSDKKDRFETIRAWVVQIVGKINF